MTYLPGTDDAIYPGTERITAVPHIEDDRHLVVLDASPTAYPLDGFLPTLFRTIVDVGLWDAARIVGSNRSAHPVVFEALKALESEPSIARCLMFTLPPDDALRISANLADAAVEPDTCAFPGCTRYRVVGEWCAPHDTDYRPLGGVA